MTIIIENWKNQREETNKKTVHQLLGMCGDGKLKDENQTSKEFREFLTILPNENIIRYTNECLSTPTLDPSNKGLPLQDLVNEIGSRLGFNITHGRYRGSPSKDEIGCDGLWATSNTSIVIEIKTSSTYSIDLNKVGSYKKDLIQRGDCSEENTSILLVVGDVTTESWEDQIRGSRRLWDTRIISVDGLLRLLKIKETIDEPAVFNRISNILTPKEYTKVDGIIDIVFSTAEDMKSDFPEVEDEEDQKGKDKAKTPKFTPVAFHEECIEKIQSHLKVELIKNSRTTYVDSKQKVIVTCLVSKEYQKNKDHSITNYWFAFHPHQEKLLSSSDYSKGYLGLGCGSPKLITLFPIHEFTPHLEKLRTTKRPDRWYYHLSIRDEGDKIFLITKMDYDNVRIEENKI